MDMGVRNRTCSQSEKDGKSQETASNTIIRNIYTEADTEPMKESGLSFFKRR